jgi:pimeloyl-ACP methyl ester carboxylesterase
MNKKVITLKEIQIAYLEQNNRSNKTIFFIHGNSVSSRTWRKQLTDPSFRNYRLIAIDLPAHGDSDFFADPNYGYSLPKLAELMAFVLLQLANNLPYIIAGISLGTNIVTEMLCFGVQPKGLILAGPSVIGKNIPVENIIKPGTHVNVVFTDVADENDVRSYAGETSLSKDEEDVQLFLEDYRAVKKPFRSSLARSIANKIYNDEILLLQQRNIPILIVFGEDEKVVENNYLNNVNLPLWKNKIFKISGASHLVHIDQPEAFNKLVKDFAEESFK